jgi:hypothetical protein
MPRGHQKGQHCKWREFLDRSGWGAHDPVSALAAVLPTNGPGRSRRVRRGTHTLVHTPQHEPPKPMRQHRQPPTRQFSQAQHRQMLFPPSRRLRALGPGPPVKSAAPATASTAGGSTSAKSAAPATATTAGGSTSAKSAAPATTSTAGRSTRVRKVRHRLLPPQSAEAPVRRVRHRHPNNHVYIPHS